MKKTLILMALAMSSLSVQANDVLKFSSEVAQAPFAATLYSTLSTGIVSSGVGFCKEAQQIIADGEEYNLTGELAPYLKQSVEILQAQSSDLSTDEAVYLLIEKAVSILK